MTNGKDSKNSPPALVDDPMYQDETADVNLISSDNKLFKVSSYYLKAHSAVIRDMIDLTNPPSPTEPMQLPLPYPSLTVLHLLRIINPPATPLPATASSWEPSVNQINSLISLTSFLAAPLIRSLLPSYLLTTCRSSSWPVFLCAAGVDDQVAAIGAVGRFRAKTSYLAGFDKTEVSPFRIDIKEVECLGVHYYRAYCRAYFEHSHEVSEDDFTWGMVAQKFGNYLNNPKEGQWRNE